MRVFLGVLAVAMTLSSGHVRGPWLLVSLPSLGTVTWRCDSGTQPRVALGFRVSQHGQSGRLTLSTRAQTVLSRVIQPGQVIALPYLHATRQRLAIAESGEDGTLRATVVVTFVQPAVSNYCWPYMPPDVRVHLAPRA